MLQTRTYHAPGGAQSGDGIFIQSVTIMSAAAFYQENVNLRSPNSPVHDIGIRLTLDIGRNFQPEMVISGNFKKDPLTGEVVDWGSAFVVNDFLVKLGVMKDGQNLTADNKIPPAIISDLIGKQFFRLSYQAGINPSTGKTRYFDWNQIAVGEKGVEALRKRFKAAVEQGRVRNFKPADGQPAPATGGGNSLLPF